MKAASEPNDSDSRGEIVAVNGNLVTVEFAGEVRQNEIVGIPRGEARLQAEVVRVRGRLADLQVFEPANGIKIGDAAEFTGEMLSVELGPGLLGRLYDGLQNPLNRLAERFGNFLPRGVNLPALDAGRPWDFHAVVRVGDRVSGGDAIGWVEEGLLRHKILAPFDLEPGSSVRDIEQRAHCHVDQTVARVATKNGDRELRLGFRWPVRVPIRAYEERLPPTEPLTTQIRIIDTMFPVAKGGAYCIPGPFGAGKTVLQQITSRMAEVDVVIIAACGERAGEVVETIRDFPKIIDPRTGHPLMERTIIICNTSSMPVAAREASVYTAVTMAEYYRQMGLDVLLLADSTSRWAQAMRERSGRLEEIPGEEAFPAYLESTVADFYERAGRVQLRDGSIGSVTIGGTVSPAGGNFEEPVTQATLKVVGAFHALSRERADARRFPSIDPLESWSRYDGIIGPARLRKVKRFLTRAHEIDQMMKVVGDEGTSLEDFVLFLKGGFFDDVYLQQNAFDPVDAATPAGRQRRVFSLLENILDADLELADRHEARAFFQQLRQLFLDLNGVAMESEVFESLWEQILERLDEKQRWERAESMPPDRSALVESDLDADARRQRRLRPSINRELLMNDADEKNDQ